MTRIQLPGETSVGFRVSITRAILLSNSSPAILTRSSGRASTIRSTRLAVIVTVELMSNSLTTIQPTPDRRATANIPTIVAKIPVFEAFIVYVPPSLYRATTSVINRGSKNKGTVATVKFWAAVKFLAQLSRSPYYWGHGNVHTLDYVSTPDGKKIAPRSWVSKGV